MATSEAYGIDGKGQGTTHAIILDYLKTWVDGTKLWREQAKTDLDYVNGKQEAALRPLITKNTTRRPTITNEIRPQAELLAGTQRAKDFQFLPTPRGREDQRLSDICTSVLKAVFDYAKEPRVSAKVFDDGTASGMGVSHVGTNLDDADDIVWGDLFIQRLNQFAFIFDPWGTTPDFQDGAFMGHLEWISEDLFKKTYPNEAIPPRDGWAEFLTGKNFGENPSLNEQLLDSTSGQIRIATVYYRVPTQVWFIVDESNGDVYEGAGSEKKARKVLNQLVEKQADDVMDGFAVGPPQMTENGAVFLVMDQDGSPQMDATGQQPQVYLSLDEAEAALAAQKNAFAAKLKEMYTIQKRKITTIHWAIVTAFGVLDEGQRDPTSRRFPYNVYVQRQWGDDVMDIEGVGRQVRGRQDQVNKRNNFIDLNLAHSANSGWLNKKNDGADTKQLELFGSQPGVVVEWGSVRPEQIQAAQIPVGHFTMLQEAINGIPRATGINNELLGLTSNSTVSGKAITARQQGGQLVVLPRMEGFTDYKLDLAVSVIEEIQLNMPVKKIQRIVGSWERKQRQPTVFFDPVKGTVMNDAEIMALLVSFKSVRFDLALQPAPPDDTARQMEFTKELELTQLITSSGRRVGAAVFEEMINTANVNERFKSAALKDLQAEQDQMAAQQQGGQIAQILNNQRGRGSDGTNQG